MKPLAAFWALTKPRITSLVVLSAWMGQAMAARQFDLPYSTQLLHLLFGTWLSAAGASAFNQYVERALDAKMHRTRHRPLPAGQINPTLAFIFSIFLCLAGLFELFYFINFLTAFLSFLTIVTYVGIYTPLKTRSSLCTLVGAVPGAIPPLMGWAAINPFLTIEAWVLFAILFLWQLPHFLAIAVMYRDDYAQAGFPMLPIVNHRLTYPMMILYSAVLIPITLLPQVLGMTGASYGWGALLCGAGLMWASFQAARTPTITSARRLLLASVIYLPILLIWMVLA